MAGSFILASQKSPDVALSERFILPRDRRRHVEKPKITRTDRFRVIFFF